jgi:hypothetical protein
MKRLTARKSVTLSGPRLLNGRGVPLFSLGVLPRRFSRFLINRNNVWSTTCSRCRRGETQGSA